jgi:ABC-2 type transport system permease protein
VKLSRILVVTRRIFLGLKRDRRSIGMMIVAPIMAMFVFGIAFSGDVKDVDVVIINSDSGAPAPFNNGTFYMSRSIINNLDDEMLNIEYMSDPDSALDRIENGEVYAVIEFPEDFTGTLMQLVNQNSNNNSSSVQAAISTQIIIHSDYSNVNVANAIIQAVSEALTETLEERGFEVPIQLQVDPVYAEDAEFIDVFVPGIIAFVIFLLTTLLTLISFVGERTQGTLERLMATPIDEGDIVMGYALAFGIIGMIQAMILLTVGIVVFDIIIVGNILLAFLIAALLAVVSQALGILLSSAAKREAQAVQFIPFIVLPAFLLSGIFWPLEAIPAWLRPASYFIPPTYAVNAMRSVALRGWGLEQIWPELVALLVFAIAFLSGAILMLKRSRK